MDSTAPPPSDVARDLQRQDAASRSRSSRPSRRGRAATLDNLTIAHWVGATSVKSVEYFRRVHHILAPGGVFVYHGNWGGARRAILAGLVETFRHVRLHPGGGPTEEVVLAADHPIELDPDRVATVLRDHPAGGMRAPEELIGGLRPVTRADFGRARPMRDDVLVYEYHRDPIRTLRHFVRGLWFSVIPRPGLPAASGPPGRDGSLPGRASALGAARDEN